MKKVIVTHREQTYIERYIDGELQKMFKRISEIHDKYKGKPTEDINLLYVNNFFADNNDEIFKYKKMIQNTIKDRKKNA